MTAPAQTYARRTPHGLGTCALGAAAVARFGATEPRNIAFCVTVNLAVAYPELDAVRTACPGCGHPPDRLYNIIVHLNDDHRWTREAIADFIDTLSVDLTPATVEQAVAV